LIMVAGKPCEIRDIADINGSTARGHNITKLEIFEPLGFRIDECPTHSNSVKTIICFFYARLFLESSERAKIVLA
jgi:hypothetical protein